MSETDGTDVERVFRDIRDRVRSEAAASSSSTKTHIESAPAIRKSISTHRNGSSELLARIDANLATADRAWNRLPPLMSNRTGSVANIELWIKRKIKRALHWITWEQVNFNSSVLHTLRDARSALAEQQRHFEASESRLDELEGSAQARLESVARLRTDLDRFDSGLAELRNRCDRLTNESEQLRRENAALTGNLVSLRDELRSHAAQTATHEEKKLAALQREIEKAAFELRQELRVCFKQLSLEASEAAVASDRGRRALSERLDAIEGKSGKP